jgi:hypothetical protein
MSSPLFSAFSLRRKYISRGESAKCFARTVNAGLFFIVSHDEDKAKGPRQNVVTTYFIFRNSTITVLQCKRVY